MISAPMGTNRRIRKVCWNSGGRRKSDQRSRKRFDRWIRSECTRHWLTTSRLRIHRISESTPPDTWAAGDPPRDNMQTYLASQVVSPTYQVLARMMTLDTQQHAQKILDELKHGGDFGKLAKANSVDNQTATSGGSLGWLAHGQYTQNYTAANVEMWLFNPARSINELSPIIKENGTFRIVQLLGVDPSRVVDASTLQTLKSNALTIWLTEQQALPGTVIAPVDQNMLLDPMNMPPDLPLGISSTIAAPCARG